MQGKLTVVGLVAGLTLMAAAMPGLWSDGSETEFGDAPAAAPSYAPVGEYDDRGSSDYEPVGAAPEAVVARPARLQEVAAGRLRVRPARIAIDRLGIRAPVDPVGLEPDGGLEIPADVTRAGWYEPTAMAGAAQGSTVVTAHVDSSQQGAGAFFPLRQAVPGDRITVSDTSSRTAEYEVTAATTYDKDELPISELFRADGEHRLVLITCGGAFDEQRRSYEENLVVIATVVD